MRHPKLSIVLILLMATALALVAAPVLAQKMTGEIRGNVEDAEGNPLPGATITLEGEGLIQRQNTTTTTQLGFFHFRNLDPGEYRLTVSMPGFQERVFDVSVSVGRTVTVETQLQLTGVEEDVTVVAEAPMIDKANSDLSSTYNEELIQSLPLPREFIEVADMTPAVTDGGAAYGGGSPEPGNRRTGSASNAYRLNGVDVSDPDWGNTWINPSVDTIAEVQLVGVGASAEHGNFMGTTLNIVTKGGTNDFHGSGAIYYESSDLWADNSEGVEDLIHPDLQYNRDLSASLGGPIVQEHLLFFFNVGHESRGQIPYLLTEEAEEEIDRTRFHTRVDWLLDDANTVGLMFNTDPRRDRNLGLMSGAGPEIAYGVDFGSTSWLASWQSQLGDSSYLDVRYAGYEAEEEYLPAVCCDTPLVYDASTGLSYGSSGWHGAETNGRHEVNAKFTHYADDFLGASHDLKFGVEYESTHSDYEFDYTAGGSIWLYPYYGYTYVYGYTYNAHINAKVKRGGGFVQDDVRVSDKLNLNLGVRFDFPRIFDNADSPAVPGGQLADYEFIDPRLGLTYDLKGDGNMVAHASYGRYHGKAMSYAVLGGGGNVYEALDWYLQVVPWTVDPTTADFGELQDLAFQPENFWFSFVPEILPVDPDLTGPYTDAFNAGIEFQLTDDLVLGLDYVHKRDRDFITWEDRADHTYEAAEFTDPTGGTQQYFVRTDDLPEDWIITNDPYYYRNHHFATVSLEKHLRDDRFRFLTSLTYQRSRGNIDNTLTTNWGVGAYNESNSPNFRGNPIWDGALSYEREWQFKAVGTWLAPAGIRLSAYYQGLSGRPWAPRVRAGRVSDFADPFVTFKGILLEERGNRHMDPLHRLDLRVDKTFEVGEQVSLELMFDVFNALNDRAPRDVYSYAGSFYPVSGEDAFGRPTTIVPPRRARLGFRVVF